MESLENLDPKKVAEDLHNALNPQKPELPPNDPPPWEPLPQPEVVVTEKNLEAAYGDAVSAFVSATGDTRPFSFEDFAYYCRGLDLETATENDKSSARKTLDALVAQGKFKKVGESGDKYKVVPLSAELAEAESAPSIEPAPKPTVENSEGAPAMNFNPGDKVVWDGQEEVVKSNDGQWVTFESGKMVALEELISPRGAGIVEDENEPEEVAEAKEGLDLEIENAKSFNELYYILNEARGIQSGDFYYNADYLIQKIEDYRKNPLSIILEFITKANGLRDKVRRLHEAETAGAEPVAPAVPEPAAPTAPEVAPTLSAPEAEVESAGESLEQVDTKEINPGDVYEIKTLNSTYFIKKGDDGFLYIKKHRAIFDDGFSKIKRWPNGKDSIWTDLLNPGFIEISKFFYFSTEDGHLMHTSLVREIHNLGKKAELSSPTPEPAAPTAPEVAPQPAEEQPAVPPTEEPLSQPLMPPVPPMPETTTLSPDDRPIYGPITLEETLATTSNSTEKEKIIKDNLDANRNWYTKQLVDFKNKNREKKKWFAHSMSEIGANLAHNVKTTYKNAKSDLGFERQMPESQKSQSLKDAERQYISAKKEKMKEIADVPVTDAEIKKLFPGYDPTFTVKEEQKTLLADAVRRDRIVSQAEKEWDALQKRILDNTLPLEKGRVRKSLEWWSKQHPAARIAMSTALMTAGGLAFGTITLGGVGGTLVYRGAKSGISMLAGQGAGAMMGIRMKRKSEARTKEAKQKYGEKIDATNFEEKEKELMRFYESEENQKTKDRLKKIGAMMVTGAATNLVADSLTEGIHGSIPGAPGQHSLLNKLFHKAENKIIDIVKGPRATLSQEELSKAISDKIAPPKLSGKADELFRQNAYEHNPELAQQLHIAKPPVPTEVPKIPDATPAVPEVSVELDKLGFIKTFQDLKHQLNLKYPNPNAPDVPPGVKHFLQTPSTKLAQEYGFWDTKTGQSAMGYKGEHLAVDAQGNLKLEHLAAGGKPPVTDTIGTGDKSFEAVHPEKMKIFGPKPHEVAPAATPEPTAPQEVVAPKTTESVMSAEPNPEPVYRDAPLSQSPDGIPVRNSLENLQNVAPEKPFGPIYPKDAFGQDIIPGAKVAEIAGAHGAIDFNFHSALSGTDLHVKVAEIAGGQKQIFVGDTPIANTINVPGGTRAQLFDAYQNGAKFKDIREAFAAAQEKLNLPPPHGSLAGHRLPFSEGGVIDVIHGAPNDPNAVQVLLNGKEIAKGLATVKGPKLTLDHTLHHNFLMADTVYDRAFKFLQKGLKLKSGADVLKDLTLPKVIHK